MNRPTRPIQGAVPSTISRLRLARRLAVPFVGVAAAVLISMVNPADASIVPTVSMGTANQFSVLAGTTVANTGPSTLNENLGLAPGSSVTGFPPGIVNLPATIHINDGVAAQGQVDLTAAYTDAAGRPVEFTQVNPDLVGVTLAPGVYESSAHGALGLTGQLVLDGQGNANAVFIFQTNSTLITGAGSTIELINGASECNVFWQVGSSATIGTNSNFVGNILALTSVTVETGAVIHGRALARNGAVTLDSNVFTSPSCVPSAATTPTTIPAIAAPTTTAPTLVVTDITLPRTGTSVGSTPLYGAAALVIGAGALVLARRRRSVA
ncbi:MAG: ice-binding family protein [Ilumatobacteraceae bacterium]